MVDVKGDWERMKKSRNERSYIRSNEENEE